MLNAKERNDCLYSLVYQYIAEKRQNIVYERENSSAYENAKGKLIGFCMAYEYDIIETQDFVQIETKSGKKIIKIAF